MKPCPTCPAFIPPGTKRCASCTRKQRAADRKRNPQQQRPRQWRTIARQFLDANPTCRYQGCTAKATVVDHGPPRRILLALNIFSPDNPPYLHPLCRSHHDRITQTIDVPLLHRLDAGDDPQTLAELSLVNRYQPHPRPEGSGQH